MTTACQRNLPTVPASSVCFCANTRSVQSESQLGVFGVAALAPPLSRHRFFRVVATRNTLLRGREQATEIYPLENEKGGCRVRVCGGGGGQSRSMLLRRLPAIADDDGREEPRSGEGEKGFNKAA